MSNITLSNHLDYRKLLRQGAVVDAIRGLGSIERHRCIASDEMIKAVTG